MARVKRGVTARAAHKKVIKKAAKGYFGRRKNIFRAAVQAVEKAGQYAYRDRRSKKRNFRALWIQRINAATPRARASPMADLSTGSARPESRSTAKFSPISPCASRRLSQLSWRRRKRLSSLRQHRIRFGPGSRLALAERSMRSGLLLLKAIAMTVSQTLERIADRRIAAAADEAALEAVARRGARQEGLDLRAHEDAWAPWRRRSARTAGAALNALKDKVADAIAARKAALQAAALEARLATEKVDVTLAGAARSARHHPSGEPGLGGDRADLGRSRLLGRRRPAYRGRLPQLHRAQHAARASGPPGARHLLFPRQGGRLAHGAAHPYQPGADPHHAGNRSRRSASSRRGAPSATIPIRPTRRCSTRSRAWSSTRRRISAISNGR